MSLPDVVSGLLRIGRRGPVFAPVSRCVPSQEHRRVKIAPRQFCPFWAQFSVRRKRSRRKALALFAPMPIHSSPQCELPQGFAGFGN